MWKGVGRAGPRHTMQWAISPLAVSSALLLSDRDCGMAIASRPIVWAIERMVSQRGRMAKILRQTDARSRDSCLRNSAHQSKIGVMAKMEKKTLSDPEEKRSFDKGQLELVTLGGVTFGRATLQPGWKWSTCVKPIVNTKSWRLVTCNIMSRVVSGCAWTTGVRTSLVRAKCRFYLPDMTHGL